MALIHDRHEATAWQKKYAAWPTRLYLVGLDGRVVYHGGLGPFGFSPRKLGVAIERTLDPDAG